MPENSRPATLTAHISRDAKFIYGRYCLSLQRASINLTNHEILERIMSGLSKKHIELILVDAIKKLSNDQLEPSKECHVTYHVSLDAHLAYQELVLLLQHERREIKYGKQVVQGLFLALERPDVQDPLLALMRNNPATGT